MTSFMDFIVHNKTPLFLAKSLYKLHLPVLGWIVTAQIGAWMPVTGSETGAPNLRSEDEGTGVKAVSVGWPL